MEFFDMIDWLAIKLHKFDAVCFLWLGDNSMHSKVFKRVWAKIGLIHVC